MKSGIEPMFDACRDTANSLVWGDNFVFESEFLTAHSSPRVMLRYTNPGEKLVRQTGDVVNRDRAK